MALDTKVSHEPNMYDYVNSFLMRLEHRTGRIGTACLVGLTLFILACLYVRPGYQTETGLGANYAELSRHPFSSGQENPVAFRFLTPLISYLIGLRGGLIVITNLIFALLFIIAVYYCYRRLSDRPADAALAASVITFSLVTLTTIYYSGFCDTLTYVALFLMWFWRRQPFAFWSLFIVGMFNRESMAFLAPWFLFIRFIERKSLVHWLVTDLLGLVLSAAVVLAVRQWQTAHFKILLSSDYYLEPLKSDPLHFVKQSYPLQGLGLFSVYKALWAIPIVAFCGYWRERRTAAMLSAALLLLCTVAQLSIAYDSSRMLTMSFMLTMIALTYFFETGAAHFRTWAFPLLLGNLLVPQLYTAAHQIELMYSLPGNLILWIFLHKSVW